MQKITGFLITYSLAVFVSHAAYAASADTTVSHSPGTDRSDTNSGRDVFGNLVGMDVQGNPNDKNVQGSRPKDVQGNPPHDIYGNKTGSENK